MTARWRCRCSSTGCRAAKTDRPYRRAHHAPTEAMNSQHVFPLVRRRLLGRRGFRRCRFGRCRSRRRGGGPGGDGMRHHGRPRDNGGMWRRFHGRSSGRRGWFCDRRLGCGFGSKRLRMGMAWFGWDRGRGRGMDGSDRLLFLQRRGTCRSSTRRSHACRGDARLGQRCGYCRVAGLRWHDTLASEFAGLGGRRDRRAAVIHGGEKSLVGAGRMLMLGLQRRGRHVFFMRHGLLLRRRPGARSAGAAVEARPRRVVMGHDGLA